MAWWVIAAKIVSAAMAAQSFSDAEEKGDLAGMISSVQNIGSAVKGMKKPPEKKMEAMGPKTFQYRKPPIGGTEIEPKISDVLGKLGKQAYPQEAKTYDRIRKLWEEEE